MSRSILSAHCYAGNRAARTNSGHEIIINWPDEVLTSNTAMQLTEARYELVIDRIATWQGDKLVKL